MEPKAPGSLAQSIFEQEALSRQDLEKLQEIAADPEQRPLLEEAVKELCESPRATGVRGRANKFKCAAGLWALGRFEEAIGVLPSRESNADEAYLRGICLMELERPKEAQHELEAALAQDSDAADILVALADARRALGDTAKAFKLLEAAQKSQGETAALAYVRGRCLEDDGRYEEAAEQYARALVLDPNRPASLFRLAQANDRMGDEDESLQLYERCVALRPTYVNACLNLGILYEDRAQYERAIGCYRRVLTAYPNHPRAKLYLRDALASLDMYYDEEKERRADIRSKILEISISNFELSVRSRHCLERIGIATLGDLTRTTEAQLLACKNFGETSLTEIRKLLSQHGLQLGEALEEPEAVLPQIEETGSKVAEDVLSVPVSELNLSIRGRRCLERLNVNTLGELVRKSERDLLACKNFGQRSLLELRQRLSKYGLVLREEAA